MFMIKRCPYCHEWVKKRAVVCKHCKSKIGEAKTSSVNDDEVIRFIQNGFAKVQAECHKLEASITARKGFVFTTYAFGEDELMEAACRIDSWCEKIRSDLENWDAKGSLSDKARFAYNEQAEEAQDFLERIAEKIQERKPTWWEKVSNFFKTILSKLLPFLSLKVIAGSKKPSLATQMGM
jgi:hypothetical protein